MIDARVGKVDRGFSGQKRGNEIRNRQEIARLFKNLGPFRAHSPQLHRRKSAIQIPAAGLINVTLAEAFVEFALITRTPRVAPDDRVRQRLKIFVHRNNRATLRRKRNAAHVFGAFRICTNLAHNLDHRVRPIGRPLFGSADSGRNQRIPAVRRRDHLAAIGKQQRLRARRANVDPQQIVFFHNNPRYRLFAHESRRNVHIQQAPDCARFNPYSLKTARLESPTPPLFLPSAGRLFVYSV